MTPSDAFTQTMALGPLSVFVPSRSRNRQFLRCWMRLTPIVPPQAKTKPLEPDQ
jgi:hypothetical protein